MLCSLPGTLCPFPRLLRVFVGHPQADSATLSLSRGLAVLFAEHREALVVVMGVGLEFAVEVVIAVAVGFEVGALVTPSRDTLAPPGPRNLSPAPLSIE
jgi:hypothetical protein